MKAYYNEFDPKAAAWLRELVREGHIADGDVDTRSITEVQPSDLEGYGQVHFFAGIGGWPLALRLAGVPDTEPVWTGSCPCQPYSVAGKGKGQEDERHLWPDMFRLVRQCHPARVLGEQVAAAIGHGWLDGVFADLEGEGYACGAAVLGAHSVGAPHIRQRLYWVADAERDTRGPRWIADESREGIGEAGERTSVESGRCGDACRLGDASGDNERRSPMPGEHGQGVEAGGSGGAGRLADPKGTRSSHGREGAIQSLAGECGGEAGWMVQSGQSGLEGHAGNGDDRGEPGRVDSQQGGSTAASGGTGGVSDATQRGLTKLRGESVAGSGGHVDGRVKADAWSNFIIIPCGDGKARRIEPGLSPLVDGLPGRVGLLRGYGNAIVPQVAAEFIRAVMENRS